MIKVRLFDEEVERFLFMIAEDLVALRDQGIHSITIEHLEDLGFSIETNIGGIPTLESTKEEIERYLFV